MLMMVYHCICTCIHKESICFLHTRRRQLEMLMTSMNNNKYIVCLLLCLLNSIVLVDGI